MSTLNPQVMVEEDMFLLYMYRNTYRARGGGDIPPFDVTIRNLPTRLASAMR